MSTMGIFTSPYSYGNRINISADAVRASNKAFIDANDPYADRNNSFPIVMSSPMSSPMYQSYNYKTDTPYIGINPLTSNIISSGFYKDLNKDKSVQKNLTKYYYYKILDKWIYKELMPLLAFVDTSGDKPHLIKSLSQYDVQKLTTNSSNEIEKKINYLEKVIITRNMVKHVLKKICADNGINWYDLDKNEKKIKTIFYNYLLDKLKDAIKKYGLGKD